MGWNGSGTATSAAMNKKIAKPRTKLSDVPTSGAVKGFMVLLVSCGIGGLAYNFLEGGAAGGSVDENPSDKTIAEVKADIVVLKQEPMQEVDEVIHIDKTIRDEKGKIIRDENAPLGSKANPIKFAPIKKPRNRLPPRKLYDTWSENYIVGLMRTIPGSRAPSIVLPNNFDDEFKARIADAIKYDPEDTPEDREIRESMQALKKEMAKMIGQGMTPTEIIVAERNELNRIADFRAVAAKELYQLKRGGASDQEIDDYIEAANLKMEELGAMKFKPRNYIEQIRLNKEGK